MLKVSRTQRKTTNNVKNQDTFILDQCYKEPHGNFRKQTNKQSKLKKPKQQQPLPTWSQGRMQLTDKISSE